MPILIGFAIVGLVLVVFGPIVSGLFGLFVAICGGVAAAIVGGGFLVFWALVAVFAFGWWIWSLFNPEAAKKAFAEEEKRQAEAKIRRQLARRRRA